MAKNKLSLWLEKNKVKEDIFPGAFDVVELWKLNSLRCSGKFNKIFFPIYIAFFVYAIPYSFLCLVEALLTQNKRYIG